MEEFIHHFAKNEQDEYRSVVAITKNDFEKSLIQLEEVFLSVPQPTCLIEKWNNKIKEIKGIDEK